ncbi:MAG: hypothetical protein AB1742_04685 [bacterium]
MEAGGEKAPAEKLEVLNMIREGKITPDEGVRLLEAMERAETHGEGGAATGGKSLHSPRWLNLEIRRKKGEKFKSITPIRIPFSLIKIFFRFVPVETPLSGRSGVEKYLSDLEMGKPLELSSEHEGLAIRITAE